jgi:hypothetical protein
MLHPVKRVSQRCVRHLSTPAAPAAAKPAEPVLARVYGGLKDQDRIFTNLYGEGVSLLIFFYIYMIFLSIFFTFLQDWRIGAAEKRGYQTEK